MPTAAETMRETFTVDVPAEAYRNRAERRDAAIDQARERAALYCIPASWTAKHKGGDVWEVTRERTASAEVDPHADGQPPCRCDSCRDPFDA